MADNRVAYGFRWAVAANGGAAQPKPMMFRVADDQSFDVNGGAANVRLRAGDPVRLTSSGTVGLCDGTEGAGGALGVYGIVVGVLPYYDSTIGAAGAMRFTGSLPSDVSYDTNLARQSKVLVVPVTAGIWEVDCDDSTTATTEAAYITLVGNNVDHKLCGASGESYASPRLDISTVNTTSTLIWNVVSVSPSMDNQDFSGGYVKLWVRPNVIQLHTDSDGVTGV